MLTLRKIVNRCIMLVGLAVLGTALLEMGFDAARTKTNGEAGPTSNFVQATLDQAGPEFREDQAQVNQFLKSFSRSAGLFVDRNIVSARLQIAEMASSIPSNVADILPTSALNWMHGGPQVAAQNAGMKANQLARKVPVVETAVNSTGSHFATIRDSLSSAAGF